MGKNMIMNKDTNHKALINPEQLWAIEDELINIPLQFRDRFWTELLDNYMHDPTQE